jgi:NAD dependent epimerase/dehydratase
LRHADRSARDDRSTGRPVSSLSGRLALVTGAGGFIGSHLVAQLVEDGARVRALVRYTSSGDRGALNYLDESVLGEVEVVLGDLRDSESVTEAARGVDVVFNLAAQIAIPYSYVNPRDFVETNVVGTLNVLQACRALETPRLVQTSTSEVYGTAQSVPITEEHPLNAQSPYAASKVAADQLSLSFNRSFDLPVTVLRPFNTFGPRQSARAVIPTIIVQALKGDVLRLGSLDPRRDLTFVTDCARGFTAAAGSEEAIGQTLQLGTGVDNSVGELVEAVGSILGRELTVEQDPDRVRPEASEVRRLISSPARMTELTGWRPEVSLSDGLERTIRWIEANPEAYPLEGYVI